MSRFIIWFQLDLAGKISEMCGSDSVTFFDNRKSNNTIISETLQSKSLEFRKKRGAI